MVNFSPIDQAFASLIRIKNLSIGMIFITLLLTTVMAVVISQTLTRPLQKLTRTVQKISDGDLTAKADTSSKDEIGILAHAFNQMTTRLRDLIETLEARISERTLQLEEHAAYLEASAKVSRAITTIIDLDKIIPKSVYLIQQNFKFYYVGLFLVDDKNEWANS